MKYGTVLGTLIVGMAVGAIGVFAFYHPTAGPGPSSTSGVDKLREGTSEPVDQNNARYTNAAFGFSLLYPIELTKKEFPEGGGGMTVVFQKPNEEKGFQIFIVPYAEKQISKERIQGDLEGAPMEKLTNIVLPGNIEAVHFESHAPIIGDSSEVWFIHGGYLYEITTYRALDSWLASILATLAFTK